MKQNISRLAITLATLLINHATHAAGPLLPPGPPGPTYKSLDEVQPRTPLSSLPITISQPGSYYLTTNLVGVAGQHGITITGPRVTSDLMGFELRGARMASMGSTVAPALSKNCVFPTMAATASRSTAARGEEFIEGRQPQSS